MWKLHWRRVRSRYPWLQMIQTWRFWLLVLFTVMLLTYVIVSFKSKPVMFMEREIKEIWLGDIEFDFQTGLYFLKDKKNVYLRGSMPESLHLKGNPNHCGGYNASKYLCASWYPKMKLEVSNIIEEHATCQVLTWRSLSNDYTPHTCFSLADFHWYGGSLLRSQKWPINSADIPLQPYTPHNLKSFKGEINTFGSVIDWFWISSSGVALIVDNSMPIHISVNQSKDNLMCFHSKSVNEPVLKYSICRAANLRKIHHYVMSKYVQLPLKMPKDSYFSDPIWSTSPVYKNNIDQAKLLKYGQEIQDYGFSTNTLDMQGDRMSILKPGDFDKKLFPNSHQSFMMLRGDYKFEIFLPISPFISTEENIDRSKLLTYMDGSPVVEQYQGESVNIINFSNAETLNWFKDRVKYLMKEYTFSGVHLLGAESDLPELSKGRVSSVNMENFNQLLASSMAKHLNVTITSFGSKSQVGGSIILLPSQRSSWGEDGILGIIPSVLTLGILGYPFVIPDTIGGPGSLVSVNATYSEMTKPDRELYIRWMGLSAYMPCMMFSYPPWLYDPETVDMAKRFVDQHKNQVSPLVIKAAREFEHTGNYNQGSRKWAK